jgi:hypothetical protein
MIELWLYRDYKVFWMSWVVKVSEKLFITMFLVDNEIFSAQTADISYWKAEVITVSVSTGATWRIWCYVNWVGYAGTVINNKAKVLVPELPVGKYSGICSYEWDDKYLPTETNYNSFTVWKAAPIS